MKEKRAERSEQGINNRMMERVGTKEDWQWFGVEKESIQTHVQ